MLLMVSPGEDTDKNRIMQILCDFFAKEKGEKKKFRKWYDLRNLLLGREVKEDKEVKGDKDNSWVVVTLSNYFTRFFKLHSS